MYSHPQTSRRKMFNLFAGLLVTIGAFVFVPTAEPQGVQQPLTSPSPNPFAKQQSPFPLVEEPEMLEFDALSKEEKEAKLLSEGPLIPQKSHLNNYSLRAFIKGNSPLFIDYSIEPNTVAWVTIWTPGATQVSPVTIHVDARATLGGAQNALEAIGYAAALRGPGELDARASAGRRRRTTQSAVSACSANT